MDLNEYDRIFSMVPKHACLSDLLDEWYGKGRFADAAGGLDAREKKFGPAWRKDNKCINKQQFSRTKRINNKYSVSTGQPVLEIIVELEDCFADNKQSVAGFSEALKEKGLMKKMAPQGRGKRAKQ
jgi:hypothetical protein